MAKATSGLKDIYKVTPIDLENDVETSGADMPRNNPLNPSVFMVCEKQSKAEVNLYVCIRVFILSKGYPMVVEANEELYDMSIGL